MAKINVEKAEGKLGILVVGVGGAVASTFIAGTLMARKGLGVPVGSITQLSTIKLSDGSTPKIKDVLPIAKLDDSKFNPIYHSYFTVIEQNITCLNCGCSFISSESHPLLRCNISDQTNTLLDCLALSEAKCDLPEYFCPNCKCKTTATIQHTVQKLPKYLIIGLNRQEMDHVNDKVITFETALTYESTTFILKSVVYYYHYTHKSAHYDVRGVLNDSNKLYIFNDNICKRCNQDFPFPRATVFVYERLFSDS